jgi:hypothetical protein
VCTYNGRTKYRYILFFKYGMYFHVRISQDTGLIESSVVFNMLFETPLSGKSCKLEILQNHLNNCLCRFSIASKQHRGFRPQTCLLLKTKFIVKKIEESLPVDLLKQCRDQEAPIASFTVFVSLARKG